MLPKTIGILGGMGPAVSANFHQTLIELCQRDHKAAQDTDYPRIIHDSMGMEKFDEISFAHAGNVLDQLIHGLRALKAHGAEFIVIPCNTVHHFFPQMDAAVDVPILHLIDLTVHRTVRGKYQTVGVLSSDTTNRLGLYRQRGEGYGLTVTELGSEDQDELNRLIMKVKAGTVTREDKLVAEHFADALCAVGAEAIIIGCTEIPSLLDHYRCPRPVYDSLGILAEETVKFAYGE